MNYKKPVKFTGLSPIDRMQAICNDTSYDCSWSCEECIVHVKPDDYGRVVVFMEWEKGCVK